MKWTTTLFGGVGVECVEQYYLIAWFCVFKTEKFISRILPPKTNKKQKKEKLQAATVKNLDLGKWDIKKGGNRPFSLFCFNNKICLFPRFACQEKRKKESRCDHNYDHLCLGSGLKKWFHIFSPVWSGKITNRTLQRLYPAIFLFSFSFFFTYKWSVTSRRGCFFFLMGQAQVSTKKAEKKVRRSSFADQHVVRFFFLSLCIFLCSSNVCVFLKKKLYWVWFLFFLSFLLLY